MPWNESTVYEQRVRFVLEVEQETFSFSESCRRYGISRTAGYRWWNRYQAQGLEGLHDRSHRPYHCPHATPSEVEEHIVELRRRFGWGSRKLRKLTRDHFGYAPARRTIDRILEHHDLITARRRGPSKRPHPGKPLTVAESCNHIWTVDFKGPFKMKNARYCYPLTVQDVFSRYLLACKGRHSTAIDDAMPVFVDTFREHGLPQVIRSDNGGPFASIGLARLSRLSIWFVRLGIWPETIEPVSPHQNGKHERMHRTLKREATRPPQGNLSAQQRHFNRFRETFNTVRPHEALDDETPGSLFEASTRPYPETLPPSEYPGHFEVRRVSTNGGIRWSNRWINIGTAFGAEYIGLEPIGPSLWEIYLDTFTIGWLDDDLHAIIDINATTGRNPIC
jgi:transposase InsO family protein